MLRGEAFLHRSLVPLDEVDLSTPEDRGQGTLALDDEAGLADECGMTCTGDSVPAGVRLVPTLHRHG